MTSSPALVVAVTPNPAVDVTITVDELQDEATHRIDHAQRRLGGKGVNVATVAAAQSYPAVMLGPVNDAAFNVVTNHGGTNFPNQAQVAFTDTSAPLRETWAIHRTGDNATVIINERGDHHDFQVWETINTLLEDKVTSHPGSVVTISGSWPPGTDVTTLESMISAARRGNPKAIIVDCAGENLLAACRLGCIVKPNAAEIQQTTGCTDPLAGARELLEEGAPMVVVSLGEDGLIAAQPTQTLRAKLPEPVKGNPTGAGDSLVSALATGLIDGLDFEQLIIRGVAWSAAAVLVEYAGAIDPSWKDFLSLVEVATIH